MVNNFLFACFALFTANDFNEPAFLEHRPAKCTGRISWITRIALNDRHLWRHNSLENTKTRQRLANVNFSCKRYPVLSRTCMSTCPLFPTTVPGASIVLWMLNPNGAGPGLETGGGAGGLQTTWGGLAGTGIELGAGWFWGGAGGATVALGGCVGGVCCVGAVGGGGVAGFWGGAGVVAGPGRDTACGGEGVVAEAAFDWFILSLMYFSRSTTR